MKIYLDLVLFLNFFFDFVLLFATKYILKRKVRLVRVFLGSLVGACSIFFLFIPLNNYTLFFLKIFMSILMLYVTFSYKDSSYFWKNFVTFYIVSIFLGGGLYLLNITFSYKNEGLIFFHNGLGINIIIVIVITPIIIYLYVKEKKSYEIVYQNYKEVCVIISGKEYNYVGYMDTGNHLVDPYKKRPIILVKDDFSLDKRKLIYVPFASLNNTGVITCFKPDKVIVEGVEVKNILIGISKDKFHIEGIDCILPNILKERINEENN